MSDPRLERSRQLAAEERTPISTRAREDQRLADLRELIHVLAMALTEGKAAS
jgi:hypothetical protein